APPPRTAQIQSSLLLCLSLSGAECKFEEHCPAVTQPPPPATLECESPLTSIPSSSLSLSLALSLSLSLSLSLDRTRTRLHSTHTCITYAVSCLKNECAN